jgi:molecular chaperone GrpE
VSEEKNEEQNEEPTQEVQEEKEDMVWELPDIDEAEKSEIIEETKEMKEKDTDTESIDKLRKEVAELNSKYVRLYADFDNYKRVVAKEKEELIKYSNEELLKGLLSVIDHLELALQHSDKNSNDSLPALIEGVELTLKELKTTLERYGLTGIEALGKPFDPFVHHAMTQVETDESEENRVVSEFRKGYMLQDRVLRPAFVGVSKKPSGGEENKEDDEAGKTQAITEEEEKTNQEKEKKIEIEEEE